MIEFIFGVCGIFLAGLMLMWEGMAQRRIPLMVVAIAIWSVDIGIIFSAILWGAFLA